jgi:hypothetical protein
MKWIENKRYTVSKFTLADYPFFDIEFEGNKTAGYKLAMLGLGYPRKVFKDIEDIKIYIIQYIYEHLINIKEVETLDQFKNHRIIKINYSAWPGNNGEGKYDNKNLYLNYHWLEGRFLHTSYVAKRYAIRYDIAIPKEKVEEIGVKIIKRHINRFLREYFTMVETKNI